MPWRCEWPDDIIPLVAGTTPREVCANRVIHNYPVVTKMNRFLIGLCAAAMLTPTQVGAADSSQCLQERVLTTNSAADAAQDTGASRKRRRRRRPKQRSTDYDVVAVSGGGTIAGIVLYKGKVPPPRKIQIVKDHETCDHRPKSVPRIKVNDQQQVEEAVVFLGDIRKGKAFKPTGEKPTVDQRTCTFRPHVQVVHIDQPIEIVNSDPLGHSAHITQHRKSVYNRMQPQQGMRSELILADGGLASLKCDVHDWMRAYLYVLWHPYYAVTGSDGQFRLTDVPPGQYELVVWQESLGERTVTVTVEAGQATHVDFEITRD